MTRKKKIALIITFAAIGQFLLGVVLIVVFSLPFFKQIVGESVNHFSDLERMTDYAYVDSRFGTLYCDDHSVAFQTAFENNVKNYGESHNMEDTEMAGSYVVGKESFYYALSYKDESKAYAIQVRKRSFNNLQADAEIIYTESGFSNRPYSFSGYDTKIHFYGNGTYLFSYDVTNNERLDCNYADSQTIADDYYKSNGFSRVEAKSNDETIELANGSNTINVNVKNELPEIYERLTKNHYQARTVVYSLDSAFIFFNAYERCFYDVCLRYNFSNSQLAYANSYYDKYSLGMGYQIIIPVLEF